MSMRQNELLVQDALQDSVSLCQASLVTRVGRYVLLSFFLSRCGVMLPWQVLASLWTRLLPVPILVVLDCSGGHWDVPALDLLCAIVVKDQLVETIGRA